MAEIKKHILYGGKCEVEVYEYPTYHRYKLNGEWVKSPSTIVGKLDKSGALIPWAVRLYSEKMRELMGESDNFTADDVNSMIAVAQNAHAESKKSGADVGSVVHDYAENYPKGKKLEEIDGYNELSDEEKEKTKKGAEGFNHWVKEVKPEFLKSEFVIASVKEKFAGKTDALIQTETGRYIVDYKTSSGIYSSQVYQVASYLKAYEEETRTKLDGAVLIHIRKDAKYDKEGNLIHDAGTFGSITLTRGELVKAYKAFKALLTVTLIDEDITKALSNKY